MQKYKVVMAWLKDDGAEFDPIYAEDSKQAEAIALAMLKDNRRDFEEMKELRACAMNTTK